MDYKPTLPDENVNISSDSFILSFLKYIAISTIFLICFYIIIVFIINILSSKITPLQEQKIANFLSFDTIKGSKESQYLDSVAKRLNSCAKLPYDIRIKYLDKKEPNAFAVMGGTIYITQGLIKMLESENELAFVIGHEIGHFKNKDHLKQISYLAVVNIINSFITNNNGIVQNILEFSRTKYSQSAEFKADEVGLELLVCSYGTSWDALKLFKKMDKNGSYWEYFGSSHPSFKNRIENLENKIKASGYNTLAKPLPLGKVP